MYCEPALWPAVYRFLESFLEHTMLDQQDHSGKKTNKKKHSISHLITPQDKTKATPV